MGELTYLHPSPVVAIFVARFVFLEITKRETVGSAPNAPIRARGQVSHGHSIRLTSEVRDVGTSDKGSVSCPYTAAHCRWANLRMHADYIVFPTSLFALWKAGSTGNKTLAGSVNQIHRPHERLSSATIKQHRAKMKYSPFN